MSYYCIVHFLVQSHCRTLTCIIYSNSTQPIVLATILEEMKKMRTESAMHNKAVVDNYAKMTDNYKKMNKALCDLVEQSFQIDSSPSKVHIILRHPEMFI